MNSARIDMCEITGRWLSREEAVMQSVRRIITTRLGSGLINRSFGSKVRGYLQRPVSEIKAHISQEIFISLMEKSGLFYPESVEFNSGEHEITDGRVVLTVFGYIGTRKVAIERINIRA